MISRRPRRRHRGPAPRASLRSACQRGAEGVEVDGAVAGGIEDPTPIERAILVRDQVAKPAGCDQPLPERDIDHAMSGEQLEQLSITRWHVPAFIRHPVRGQVEATLQCTQRFVMLRCVISRLKQAEPFGYPAGVPIIMLCP